MYYMYDPIFPLIILALIFAFWTQWKVKSTFQKYDKIKSATGHTGADVARLILDKYGLQEVPIHKVPGELTDNYDPRKKTLNLSENIHDSASIAAYGIAAHEAGHAIQHAKTYSPLAFRNAFFPVANIGSSMAIPLFFMGLFFSIPVFMDIGILAFAFAVVFSIVTLPVEFDASSRAVKILQETNLVSGEELVGARKVLSSAALTYLAATLMAILQFLRLIFLRNSRD